MSAKKKVVATFTIEIERTEGKPQDWDTVLEAVMEEIDALAVYAQDDDHDEESEFSLNVTKKEFS